MSSGETQPGDDAHTIPVPGEESENEMEDDVSATDLPANVGTQLITQLMQSGNVAQNNFITVNKAQDYDYLENKRMVTLDEAVGIREVQSENNPGGPKKPGT